jgi:hypothetical protein
MPVPETFTGYYSPVFAPRSRWVPMIDSSKVIGRYHNPYVSPHGIDADHSSTSQPRNDVLEA